MCSSPPDPHQSSNAQQAKMSDSHQSQVFGPIPPPRNPTVRVPQLAECAMNNHISTSTGRAPFFVSKGYHPRMGSVTLKRDVKASDFNVRDAQTYVNQMKEIEQFYREQIVLAQQEHAHQADSRQKLRCGRNFDLASVPSVLARNPPLPFSCPPNFLSSAQPTESAVPPPHWKRLLLRIPPVYRR
ncbi:hypothetical protein IWZ01DRAFT_572935 [Phyllosticta capitalensis]